MAKMSSKNARSFNSFNFLEPEILPPSVFLRTAEILAHCSINSIFFIRKVKDS